MKIRVLGAGVIGLSIAVKLLERGHDVEVVARDITSDTTSHRAAAIWYPFAAAADDRVRRWAQDTYAEFARLSLLPEAGVTFIQLTELFEATRSAPWWASIPSSFRIVGSEDLPPGYSCGLRASVPLAETPIYLPWLRSRIRDFGGRIEKRDVSSLEEASTGWDLLVNATGIGAARLVPGETRLYGLRGQTIRVAGGGSGRAFVDELGPRGLAYAVSRSRDTLLGGTATEVRDLSDENIRRVLRPDREAAARILVACTAIEAGFKECPILGHEVGLRPARDVVRLDFERGVRGDRILHCYGHGGSGFTLSWGCAAEICRLVQP